jgi:exodeoxyribonuclease VII large subunit
LTEIPNIPEFLKQIHIFGVSELTGHIKDRLTSDPNLQHIAVKGEVSNFTKSQAGHIYFSLKDSGSQVRCVSFRSRAERLSYTPKEGDEVIVFGSIDVYPQGGAYQLYVDELFHAGRGELFARYLELKDQLEKEGLFNIERTQLEL